MKLSLIAVIVSAVFAIPSGEDKGGRRRNCIESGGRWVTGGTNGRGRCVYQ
jgi:hypothetical protein